MLVEHRLASPHSGDEAFVLASRSGRPLAQRNVIRALWATQRRATDEAGRPTFPALQERNWRGRPTPPPRSAVPSFHSFRHTAAREAIAAGESAEEVAWRLGHRNSVVTRSVYIQEIRNAQRSAERRARLGARYGELLASVPSMPPQRGRGPR
jgi:integrase